MRLLDQAFLDTDFFIKPGETTELAVMNFLDARMRQLVPGASLTIIASGCLLCLMVWLALGHSKG